LGLIEFAVAHVDLSADTARPHPFLEAARPSPSLARYFLVAYVVLLAYGSLFPSTAWRASGVDPFAFLWAPWPRYVTAFDVVANLIAYLPLGLLGVAAVPVRVPRWLGVVATVVLGVGLSIMLESLQTYLPSRVASNLDVLLNSIGTGIGAIGYVIARGDRGTVFMALRVAWFRPGKGTDLGLLLLALWLFTQLNPETLLFGTGDLRNLIEAVPPYLLAASVFVRFEGMIAACNLIAVGLLAGALVMPGRSAWWVIAVLFAIALAIRTLAFGVLLQPSDMLSWLTPGAQIGIVAGVFFALAGSWLPRTLRLGAASVLTMLATVLVNLAPGNPYLISSLGTWRQGHFLNFNGMTSMVSTLWPFAALAYLLFQVSRGPRH
jgi:VanZ family protein